MIGYAKPFTLEIKVFIRLSEKL